MINEKAKVLLDRVCEQILKEPKQFQMDAFFATANGMADTPEVIPNCGTAACIAGWAIALHDGLNPKAANEHLHVNLDYYFAGIMQLPIGDTNNLIYVDQWPDEFQEPFIEATEEQDWDRRAHIAVDRIRHFQEYVV